MARKRQLVVFRIGAEEFAVDIRLTKEVVVMREITPVPETEDYVEGVMNLRGNLLPVLDLRKRLRASALFRQEGRTERIIIATVEGRMTGLIVDGASEVIRATDEMVEPAPDIISEMGAGYVLGVVNMKGRFITLIDLERVLSEETFAALDEVINLLSRGRETIIPAQMV